MDKSTYSERFSSEESKTVCVIFPGCHFVDGTWMVGWYLHFAIPLKGCSNFWQKAQRTERGMTSDYISFIVIVSVSIFIANSTRKSCTLSISSSGKTSPTSLCCTTTALHPCTQAPSLRAHPSAPFSSSFSCTSWHSYYISMLLKTLRIIAIAVKASSILCWLLC